MKDKETTNLLLIMVVSTVILIFLYLPQENQSTTPKNFTKTQNKVKANIEIQKQNVSIVYKFAEN